MDRRDFIKAAGAGAAAMAAPGQMKASSALSDDEIESRIREILPQLGLWEKVSLMSGRYTQDFGEKQKGYGKTVPFQTPGIKRFGIPGIRFIDGPRGINFQGSTAFPVAMARGATFDVELARRVGEAIGCEARAGGANYFGGVCINVLRHPAGGRAQETFGEDPYHLSAIGVATLSGVQEHVMACAKHYACNNNEDSRFYVNVKVDERTLREIYLPHFKACADAGIASVMSAYNYVNNRHCGHNKPLLRDILKDDWGFDGFVVSDFTFGCRSTVRAANAGLDVEMPGTMYYGRKLLVAVAAGLVPRKNIDDSVARLLRQQLRFIHLEDVPYDKSRVAGPEHQALALETSRKSIVLLKNNGVLPLKRNSLEKIAVLGRLADTPNIGDRGSSSVRPPYVVTPLQGLRDRLGDSVEILYEDGSDLEAARSAAKEADAVVLVAGLTYEDEGEGGAPFLAGDREHLGLRKSEKELIKAASSLNDRCVVVLMGGSAVTMAEWKEGAGAVLMAWYPGMEGGRAIADVILGNVNPCGRLPFAWPKSEDQCAPLKNWAPVLKYGYYHGYRLMDKQGFEPEFPFGFGLSYTTYRYGNLRLDKKTVNRSGKVTVKVDVANAGDVAGEEVAQLYVGYEGSKVDRPVKDLKGFVKIALEPGETRTAAFELKPEDLACYNVGRGGWEVEDIEYVVYVGPSSNDKKLLKETLSIEK
jgi:beta-glucosidase